MQRNFLSHVRSQRAVWNWMLRKKSENHLYSLTSPHYGRGAPSAPQNVPDWSIKTCPSQPERLSSNCKFHSQGTTFVRISVGDNIGPPSCAAVPKLKFSITVLRDKASLSQFHYLWPLLPPPPHTHTKLNTLDFGMKTMADLRQMNFPPMCNIT